MSACVGFLERSGPSNTSRGNGGGEGMKVTFIEQQFFFLANEY